MLKVRVEAMMWGAGTALGELPPYFMARAARLSGRPPDEDKEDLIEFEELLKKEKHPETMVTFLSSCIVYVYCVVIHISILDSGGQVKIVCRATCKKSWFLWNISLCICKLLFCCLQ